MYPDETHLTFAAKTVSNIDSNVNEDLSRVNNWLTANKLTLNTSKTEFMLIGSRQRLSTFDTSLFGSDYGKLLKSGSFNPRKIPPNGNAVYT